MGWIKSTALTLAAGMILFATAGCKQEGPAEKAGKELDKAAEHTGKAMEDMGKHVQEESKH